MKTESEFRAYPNYALGHAIADRLESAKLRGLSVVEYNELGFLETVMRERIYAAQASWSATQINKGAAP